MTRSICPFIATPYLTCSTDDGGRCSMMIPFSPMANGKPTQAANGHRPQRVRRR
ncbi:hypothetical protein BIFCAT_00510 [Bifidobacterium catenulatum DSM 16992 = JCM 1194 = LMG 11043]|uniref:Uncharacterized protein n=1 Tax=Bifidobacterium catenulatum DSM 16992 = JCM 1194 = LMG 11043 TaxID=566552 RepID=B6XTG7_9BIFI|nr:hypothetical protein BIFCAT_00510 [Bifidobacterium catenulatum DSM 16992 = JCM 1194 = LMG 11043]